MEPLKLSSRPTSAAGRARESSPTPPRESGRPGRGEPTRPARSPAPTGGGGSGATGAAIGSSRPGTKGAERLPSAPGSSRRMLPAELGLAGKRILTLPSYVDQCEQGEQCCWRWLAHAVLKEATWLKEDLDTAREEHLQYTRERHKAEHDAEAFAELRGAHSETQRELSECRSETGDLRRELAALKMAHAHKSAREQELERELARLEKAQRETGQREVAAMRRAEVAERDLARATAVEEDLQQRMLQLEDLKARLGADLQEARAERDTLRKAAEEEAERKKKGKKGKRNQTGSPGRAPGRAASTTRRL